MTDSDRPLRIALLTYRGKPTCGGQGVYVRNLSRELVRLGHLVDVISGPPYPDIDDGVSLHKLDGLDLYAEDNPFRTPHMAELRSVASWIEYLGMRQGRFSEPLAFSLRARRHLRRQQYDIVHDNQSLGYGLLALPGLVATIHHPIAIDRDAELIDADDRRRRELRAWYSFITMQHRVARRIGTVLTPTQAARAAIGDRMGVSSDRMTVTPLGVDTAVFHPDATVQRVPGRIVTTASADVPLKGLRHLLIAFTELIRFEPAELHIVGSIRPGGVTSALIGELGIGESIRLHERISTQELAALLRGSQAVCVPSLFEGFCLPAVEAMACGAALVTTTAGAIPEVTGPSGQCALHVPPGEPAALAEALRTVLTHATLRERLGAQGAIRAQTYTWRATAEATIAAYRRALPRGPVRPITAPVSVRHVDH